MSFTEDRIEQIIGRFGRYQVWILFLVTLGRYPAEFQLVNVVFIVPSVEFVCKDDDAFNVTNHCPCQQPEYDQSTIVSSVTTEWNLICNRSHLASLAQSILQIGILAGSLAFGHISDRYGRKIAVVLALFLEAVFVTLSAFVTDYWMFMVSRFLIGTALGGTMLCCFVLLVELSGRTMRPYIMGLCEVPYVSGYVALPIIAYFVREWRPLQLVTGAPWLLTLAFYWMLPESPRWLITVGKKKQAIELLTYIAKKNNRPTDNIETIVNEVEKESMSTNENKHGSYIDLFKTPKIRKYTIISALVWMCCSHTFFGINQYVGHLQGNLYVNVIVTAASNAPGVIIVVIATLHFKRRVTLIASFAIAGASFVVFVLVPSHLQWVTLMFAIIGQMGVYTAFMQIYMYSSEMFPTVVRNSALGFSSVFARLGGFIAPYVVNIGIEWASILIFSAAAFGAAILCCFFPETKGVVLSNAIDQVEDKDKTSSEKMYLSSPSPVL